MAHLKPKTLQEYRVTGGGPKFYKLGPRRNARVVYKRNDLTEWVGKHAYQSGLEFSDAIDILSY